MVSTTTSTPASRLAGLLPALLLVLGVAVLGSSPVAVEPALLGFGLAGGVAVGIAALLARRLAASR